MDLNDIALVLLASIAAGGLAYVFIYPFLSGEKRAEQRQKALAARSPERRVERKKEGQSKREQIAQSLRELEARQNEKNRVTLQDRIEQAGLTWTRGRYFAASSLLGLLVFLFIMTLTGSMVVAGLAAFTGAAGLPYWMLGYMKKRRINKFIIELPNAMDVIVRGIRAGLPLGDCIREIAGSASEPLRTEFRMVTEAQTMGVPLGDSLDRMADRVPVPEATFFATVITIQTKAGGNLSEALSNLSKVLRERRKMQGKILAMSMEAKASAAIIAALPFIVALMTYVSSPSYIELLWLTITGRIVLGICAFWMLIGVAVMKN
ncbi:MAG TPA: type II secretion system F family protein, partial [Saliniramus sp.]|nr:type II secretion system F family protein [Saliniramus sp.]